MAKKEIDKIEAAVMGLEGKVKKMYLELNLHERKIMKDRFAIEDPDTLIKIRKWEAEEQKEEKK